MPYNPKEDIQAALNMEYIPQQDTYFLPKSLVDYCRKYEVHLDGTVTVRNPHLSDAELFGDMKIITMEGKHEKCM